MLCPVPTPSAQEAPRHVGPYWQNQLARLLPLSGLSWQISPRSSHDLVDDSTLHPQSARSFSKSSTFDKARLHRALVLAMASNLSTSRLTELTISILESVGKLEEMLSKQGYPSPSFDEDAPALLPKNTVSIRDLIVDSAAEIQDLLQGPLDIIYRHGSVSDYQVQ